MKLNVLKAKKRFIFQLLNMTVYFMTYSLVQLNIMNKWLPSTIIVTNTK